MKLALNLVPKDRGKSMGLLEKLTETFTKNLQKLFIKKIDFSQLTHRIPPEIVSILRQINTISAIEESVDFQIEALGLCGSGGVCRRCIYLTKYIFVIKHINMEAFRDKDYLRLQRELNIQSSLSHRRIPSLYHSFYDSATSAMYLVMQYAGEDLFDQVLNEKEEIINVCISLSHTDTNSKKMTCQILETLSYLHFNNIIHRDIKPPNVLVYQGELVYLIDFGHAIKIENGKGRKSLGCGTPGFQAPEMLVPADKKGGSPEYSYPVDVFALGCTIADIYAGDDTEIRQIIKKMTSPLPEDRGNVDYWCTHKLFHVMPSSELTQEIIPIQDRYPDIFTQKRLQKGQLQLNLCRSGIIDEAICFSMIKNLQKENDELKKKRKREDDEQQEPTKKLKVNDDENKPKGKKNHGKKANSTQAEITELRDIILLILNEGNEKLTSAELVERIEERKPGRYPTINARNIGKSVLKPMLDEKPRKIEKINSNRKKKYYAL